ncbi:WW domain [Phytophthora cinnamomi]|uniref:WW domain n=1 Tax=Phytophthora cinnamomi TaxID=4785 RepID=UPI003559B1CD|nr:WW domain [Phytophthora cinnamomi]
MEPSAPPETEAQATPPPEPVEVEAALEETVEDSSAAAAATEEGQKDKEDVAAVEATEQTDEPSTAAAGSEEEEEKDAQNGADVEAKELPSTPEEEEVAEPAESSEAAEEEKPAVEQTSAAEEKQEDPSTEEEAAAAATPAAGSDNEETEAVDEQTVEDDTAAESKAAAGEGAAKLEPPLTIIAPESPAPLEGEEMNDSTPMAEPALLTGADDSDESAAEGITPAHGASVDDLIADEAVATPDTALQFPQELDLASPAVMPELLVAPTDAETRTVSDSAAVEAEAKESEQEPTENGEKTVENAAAEEGEHATITAVAESAEKMIPIDANLEEVLARIRKKVPCESVEVLESGEILALPKGWSTRQSKTNDGKTYYVSPYGHTQWLRPPMKTGVIYNWVHEIEVTFGPGRLGLNLKQIAGIPGTVFTDLQVHIAEIYKLPNGMASPAEIYNWSVKPEKRLAVNMRVTMMNGISLSGYTYSEVLELLARMVRPVRIKFADISKGIVGRVEEEIPHEETEEGKEARAARVMQNSRRVEYFQILVSYELHKQVWASTKQHTRLKRLGMEKKCEVMESQIEGEEQHKETLEKEREHLIQETASLKEMIETLDKQTAGNFESPEALRTAELTQRTAELEKEVTEIIAENEELQAARVKIEETLDTLQKELDEYGDLEVDTNGLGEIKFFSPAFLGSMVQRGSIDTRAEDARERLLEKIKAQRDHLEEDIKLEEERTMFVESEIHQFQQQMDVAAAAVKREDEFISGERPPQLIFLENKIALLRKNLRETVAGIAKATSSADQQQAENLSLRRADLKDDLKTALDEMRRMENDLQVFFDVDEGKKIALQRADSSVDTIDIDEAPHERASETSRLQNKLTKLQAQLHETVVQLAKAAGEKDEERKSELSTRRLQLKDEMKIVQDQFQALTNGTLNVSAKSKDTYLRPSIVGPPTIQDPQRRSTAGSRASLSGIRGSMGGSRASFRGSLGGNRPSANGQRGSERHEQNLTQRSSSSASIGSLTQSYNSNSNQIPREGMLPTMCGVLRKHPTHSNEKGTFGNMSLRGVRERWCNIEPDGYLRYYKREGDREPRGAIPLNHKSLEILHGKEVGKPNEFMICSPTHQTRMTAKSHEEMLKWVKVLQLTHQHFMNQGRGSTDGGPAAGSISSVDSTADQAVNAASPDAELEYRNQRATLGF